MNGESKMFDKKINNDFKNRIKILTWNILRRRDDYGKF
jgi:hypothetical protein